MFLHNKKLMYTVRVDQPNPLFANLLLEQFGGANGELGAALRYFSQAWNEPDPGRRSMLADIATEELSHLEMVGQALVLLMKGSPASEMDKVEGDYLGNLLEGNHEQFIEASATAPSTVLSGGGPAFIDSAGNRFTANWVDTIGEPTADLRSNIAAEARAKITYERLIKQCDDPGLKDALTFLMTREVAHQKMFEAALDSIPNNFPPGKLPGEETMSHAYLVTSGTFGEGETSPAPGFDFVTKHSNFGFENDDKVVDYASEQEDPLTDASAAPRLRRCAQGAAWPVRVRAMRTIEWKLVAEVDGALVTASWSKHGLMCTPSVRRRCEVLMLLDPMIETVCGPIPTSLDGESWHVMVTVIRAVDRILAADWRPATEPTVESEWLRLEILPDHPVDHE